MKFEPVHVGAKTDKVKPISDAKVPMPSQEKEEQKTLLTVKARMKQEAEKRINTSFPIDAFPKRIQNVIRCFYDCYKLPIDYHAVSILVASSTALGNAFAAYYKRRQAYPPILYAAIVGYPSSGKSPGIEFGTYPIMEIEKKLRETHQAELEAWHEECYKNRLSNAPEPKRPHSRDIIINDATVEAINGVLIKNPKGLMLYQDELKAWINSMNSYRKGSDLEYWLSNWSGKTSKVSRTGKDPIWIPSPFISVVGGIQPGILHDLANDGKADNGFLARILFAYPDEMECPNETDQEPDQSVFNLYSGIITFLHNLPNRIEVDTGSEFQFAKIDRIFVPLAPEAKVRYIEFLNEYSEQMNESDEEAVKGILGKLKQYCLRISLILEMLQLACDHAPEQDPKDDPEFPADEWNVWSTIDLEEVEKLTISLQSLENAIKMTEYFRRTAFKVIERLDSPANQLPYYQKLWYDQLPELIEMNFAKQLAQKMMESDDNCKLSDSTVERLLRNSKTALFRKVGRGTYEKLY